MNKIEWTERWDAYLVNHYKDTPNKEIYRQLQTMGFRWCLTVATRHATRELGLAKTPEHIRAMMKQGVNSRESIDRARTTRNATYASERRRISLGMEQKTRMRVGSLSRTQVNVRGSLKRYNGYIIFRGDWRVYYDENTKRSEAREATAEMHGLYVYPISERQKFNANNP